ncbi:MAG: hypothetical protein Q8920_01205 [Bacillota bacterium]|nr:hypothetical protein [Bacillota bacterium]
MFFAAGTLAVCFFIWLTRSLSCTIRKYVVGYLNVDLKFAIEKSAALYSFLTYVLKAAACTVLLSSVMHISRHAVISLDIVFLFASLILILFHTIKDSRYPSFR